MFPKLAPAQLARLAAHGTRAATRAGEVLVEPGDRQQRLLVVLEGSLEVEHGQERVTLLERGDFSGELSTLRGTGGFTRIRVREPGSVVALDAGRLREIVQTDAELSEILMRAFILRRMGLLAAGNADVTLLGSRHSAGTLKLREFLTRNAHPFVSMDVEADAGAQALLDRFRVSVDEVPVVIGSCGRVFRNPSVSDLARYLQMNPAMDESGVHDLIVVGAGPAGLSAAVYAASEGLNVQVVEALAYGGQAGSSSKIENYLGFPTGISGQALAGRAFVQAQKFAANINVACQAVRLDCERRPYELELADGRRLKTKSVIIATGAQYREPRMQRGLRASSAPACTTPRRTSSRSSARARRSRWSAAAIRRGRRRCSSRRAAGRCACWCAAQASPRACRATSFAASKSRRTSPCTRAARSARSKATAASSASRCATPQARSGATSRTCS